MDTVVLIKEKQRKVIFKQLEEFVGDIIGRDVIEEIGIAGDSTFTKDLEMDSIEIVTFAEKVKKKYGHEIDFIPWLSSMEFQDLYNLSVGQVVDYIVSNNDSN